MDLIQLGKLLGGLGLFMIGLRLMTEGLQTSAGKSLRSVLRHTTGTPLLAVITGTVLTAVLQSSSATTVATIGFVNAGLIKLRRAIAIIYGTNIGTTMTAWLVALVGIDVEIKAFALPLVGLGAMMRISSKARSYNAAGDVLSGFGVFFVGLEVMKNALASSGSAVQIPALSQNDFMTLALCVTIGIAITFLLQSSSAAIALIITAAGGQVVSSTTAAALIIGANVGTTSTALLAVIGATAAAKRVAAAHVVFNLATGGVALLFLPLFYSQMAPLKSLIGMAPTTASELALFHTCFNILGVVLFLPLISPLAKLLQKRFITAADRDSKPRYLDKTLLGAPQLAIHALTKELVRLDTFCHITTQKALTEDSANEREIAIRHISVNRLSEAIGHFCTALQGSRLPAELAEQLPISLRITRYLTVIAELAEQITAQRTAISELHHSELIAPIAQFRNHCLEQLTSRANLEEIDLDFSELQEEYQQLKSLLLQAGARGELHVHRMVIELDIASKMRRSVEQSRKARHYLAILHQATQHSTNQN